MIKEPMQVRASSALRHSAGKNALKKIVCMNIKAPWVEKMRIRTLLKIKLHTLLPAALSTFSYVSLRKWTTKSIKLFLMQKKHKQHITTLTIIRAHRYYGWGKKRSVNGTFA